MAWQPGKKLGRLLGNRCFSQFTSPQCLESRPIRFFWEELLITNVLNANSIIWSELLMKISIAKCCVKMADCIYYPHRGGLRTSFPVKLSPLEFGLFTSPHPPPPPPLEFPSFHCHIPMENTFELHTLPGNSKEKNGEKPPGK